MKGKRKGNLARINYQIKKYSGMVVGTLIIRRGHPCWGDRTRISNIVSELFRKEGGVGLIGPRFLYGNERHWQNTVKKKFRNINFFIVIMDGYKTEDIIDSMMKLRHELVMDYVKYKRGIV